MPKNRAVVLCLLCLCSTVALADPTTQSRRLEDVLTLADALPYRPRPLSVARR